MAGGDVAVVVIALHPYRRVHRDDCGLCSFGYGKTAGCLGVVTDEHMLSVEAGADGAVAGSSLFLIAPGDCFDNITGNKVGMSSWFFLLYLSN